MINLNKNKRILGVCFEPWETEIVASTISILTQKGVFSESALLIGDIFQIRFPYAIKKLNSIISDYAIQSFSLKDEFFSWQNKGFSKANSGIKINNWAVLNNLSRSTRTLFNSDHVFSCYERFPYYKPLSQVEKETIFYDICLKISQAIDNFKPEVIFCLEHNYVVKNIVSDIAKANNIQMETLIYSRIKNYYYFSDSFGMKFSEKMLKLYDKVSDSSMSAAINFVNDRATQTNKAPLYIGCTEIKVSALFGAKKKPIQAVCADGFKLAKNFALKIRDRIRSSDIIALPNTERYGSVWWRTDIYHILNFFRNFRYTFFGIRKAISSIPEIPYILYPLHYRPESSTLTLGVGAKDEDAITFICRRLPFGVKLAVKENPAMIGDRRNSFYRKIAAIDGVVLIDPLLSTIELVKKSIGVIGISNTTLLEAGLEDVPSHAMGEPEFKEFLTSSGWDLVEKFMVDCSKGTATSCKDSLIHYLAYVFDSKIDVDLGWPSVETKESVFFAANKIANGLLKII